MTLKGVAGFLPGGYQLSESAWIGFASRRSQIRRPTGSLSFFSRALHRSSASRLQDIGQNPIEVQRNIDRHLAKMWQNRDSALKAIWTLNTALLKYKDTYSKGFPASLMFLGPPSRGAKPSSQSAGFVTPELADGVSKGYKITFRPGPKGKNGNVSTYTILGRPTKYGVTGRRNFRSDESRVVRFTRENRAATVRDSPL